ncbi:MAG: delta-60 repeat domain-containing protein, partial [Flexibacteraceae bacterium]
MEKNYLARLFTFLLLLPVMVWGQQAGSLDRSFNYGRGSDYQFNYGTGANNWVNTTALQPDGKIIIGGYFTACNGTTRNRIARLNADG